MPQQARNSQPAPCVAHSKMRIANSFDQHWSEHRWSSILHMQKALPISSTIKRSGVWFCTACSMTSCCKLRFATFKRRVVCPIACLTRLERCSLMLPSTTTCSFEVQQGMPFLRSSSATNLFNAMKISLHHPSVNCNRRKLVSNETSMLNP